MSGLGAVESSEASRRIRFMVGDLVLNLGVVIVTVLLEMSCEVYEMVSS